MGEPAFGKIAARRHPEDRSNASGTSYLAAAESRLSHASSILSTLRCSMSSGGTEPQGGLRSRETNG